MRVLYFTKSAGYEHAVVRHQGGVPSHSERVLLKLGAANDIDFVCAKDGSLFSSNYFAGFDAVMFFTGGDIASVGDDGQPAVTPERKQASLRSGRGLRVQCVLRGSPPIAASASG